MFSLWVSISPYLILHIRHVSYFFLLSNYVFHCAILKKVQSILFVPKRYLGFEHQGVKKVLFAPRSRIKKWLWDIAFIFKWGTEKCVNAAKENHGFFLYQMPTSKPEAERGKVKKELKVQKAHYRFRCYVVIIIEASNANRDSGNEEQPTCFFVQGSSKKMN